jgi:YD repeat-containing protein
MKPGETAYFSYVDSQQITTTGKWTFIQKETEVPADVTNLFIRLDNNNVGTVWFDDLRIQPSDASMTTYTYQPLTGMTSVTDNSGKTVYSEYDDFGRLSATRDNNGNITNTYAYNYINNSNWQDTGVRQCVANSPTYEQIMQERDINPISLTYNQFRWKSLGTQDACIPTVYAKLSLEQPTSGDNGEETWTGKKLIVRVYSDAACTIPSSVPIGANIKITTSGSCGSGSVIEGVFVNTFEFRYTSITNYTLHTAPCYYSYSLEPGAHYIVVP